MNWPRWAFDQTSGSGMISRTSCAHRQATAILAAHASASSRERTSTTENPPIAADRGDSEGKGNQLQTVVDLLRAREVSWADIGSALGISGQSACEHFRLILGAERMRPFTVAPGGASTTGPNAKSGTSVSGHPTMWPILEKTKQSGKSRNSVLDGSPFHVQ
jgi:hypothetical protein